MPKPRPTDPWGIMKFNRKARGEHGAAMVEMALITPFLLLLLFGIIEFSWLFSQNLDVRHGAREGARLVAVNHPVGPVPTPPDRTTAAATAQTTAIVTAICGRMDISAGGEITLDSTGSVGDPATVTVTAPGNTLTGFLDFLIPDDLELASTVEIRVEQYAGWANVTGAVCP